MPASNARHCHSPSLRQLLAYRGCALVFSPRSRHFHTYTLSIVQIRTSIRFTCHSPSIGASSSLRPNSCTVGTRSTYLPTPLLPQPPLPRNSVNKWKSKPPRGKQRTTRVSAQAANRFALVPRPTGFLGGAGQEGHICRVTHPRRRRGRRRKGTLDAHTI